MSIRTFLKPLSFLPALIMMYMIYSFSAQEADVSSQVSYKASEVIVSAADRVLDLDLDSWQIYDYASRLQGRVRKLAHMGEYFLLAIAVSFPLYVYGLHGILLMLVAGFICIAYAAGDEYHQSFVSGRSAQLRDVGIDSIGVVIGIIVTRIIGFAGRKTIFRPRKTERTAPSRRQMRAMRRAEQRQMQRIREEEELADYERRMAARRADRAKRQAKYTAETGNAGRRQNYQANHRSPSRYDDNPYDDRYTADEIDDRRYDRRDDDRYEERYDRYDDDRYEERYDRYDDDRLDSRSFEDETYDDRRFDDTSDELSDDMPLSHLLHRDMRR